MIRDLCVARTGAWSANQVFSVAQAVGYQRHRNAALKAIAAALGQGTRGRGRPSINGTENGTENGTVPIKSPKGRARELGISLNIPPSDTSCPPDPHFGDLEPDVEVYLVNAADENKSGKITRGRRIALRRELHAVLDALGDRDAFSHGLRTANSAGAANANYVKKCAAGKRNEIGTPLFSSRPAKVATDDLTREVAERFREVSR